LLCAQKTVLLIRQAIAQMMSGCLLGFTNNGLERIMKEIRRRTRVVGSFPAGFPAMMLVGARLRHISTTKWGTRQYLACKTYETDVL
jgi:hypothetical protein